MIDPQLQILIEEADKKKLIGSHREAIQMCEKVLLYDLDCSEAYEEIGDNYLSLHDYQRAKKALDRAIHLNPYSPNANYLLGFVYSCLGKWKTSIEYLERADDLYPNHPEIIRCLGWSMYHDGQKKRGVIILERAVSLSPQDPLILNDLGIIYLNEKNFERAAGLFRRVLDIEPGNEKARECLNAVKFFENEYKKLGKRRK